LLNALKRFRIADSGAAMCIALRTITSEAILHKANCGLAHGA
jgi:hypothetical protein